MYKCIREVTFTHTFCVFSIVLAASPVAHHKVMQHRQTNTQELLAGYPYSLLLLLRERSHVSREAG